MSEASPLASWESFYVIIGSAAAALTGLLFIVVTLIAGLRQGRTSGSVSTFTTPNVIHFCAALAIAAILSAPWQILWNAALVLGLAGAGGVIYVMIVLRRLRHTDGYKPVMEDWIWHIVFPFTAYLALVISAILMPNNAEPALFVIGGLTILLIFIGIHNAWDTLTFVAIEYPQAEETPQNER